MANIKMEFPNHNKHVVPGDVIEFLSANDKRNAFEPKMIKGVVKKVLENSVIVDISQDSNYRTYYDHENTVVSHRIYKII